MKRLVSLTLMIALLLSISFTAFADPPTGTIKITNATKDITYTIYRIFEGKFDEVSGASYTIQSTSPWYAQVNLPSSPFVLKQVMNTSTYNVGVKSGSENQVIDWFKSQAIPTGAVSESSLKATTTTVEFSDLPLGYYLIKSDNGALVTIDNLKSGTNEIIDKNQSPSWIIPSGGGQAGKNVSTVSSANLAAAVSAGIGDKLFYQINAFVPKYDKENAITAYTLTDTLAKGLTYDAVSGLTLTLKNGLDQGTILTYGTDYTVTYTAPAGNSAATIVVVLNVSTINNYPTDGQLEIKYAATVNEDAQCSNSNTASLSWTKSGSPGSATLSNPTTATANVYGFRIQKYKEDATAENKLSGAEFRLYTQPNGGDEIKVKPVGDSEKETGGKHYHVDKTQTEGAVIEAGYAEIFGLPLGTYWIEETKAPGAYNLLSERVKIEITADNTSGG